MLIIYCNITFILFSNIIVYIVYNDKNPLAAEVLG